MLMHHGSTDYNVSASEAAKQATSKFQAEIDAGKAQAQKVLESIFTNVPQDRIVTTKKLTFSAEGNQVKVHFPAISGSQVVEGFHRHAIQQAASRSGIPLAYIDSLLDKKEEWAQELVAENLNKLFAHAPEAQRNLTRSVHGEVRGFLSDSYRRMDSRPIVESFATAMQKYGAVPVGGYSMDTKVAIKAVLPYIFEPVPNEVMTIGVYFGNSDFGNGALELRTFINRLWCTNRAISTEDIRKVHLGARLSEDLQLSQRTYDLDTQTMASAVADIMDKSLAPENVNKYTALVSKANAEKIEPAKVTAFLKANLLKGEVEQVLDAFKSPDVEMLPPGNTVWRMSNAISWIANSIEEPERKLEVMKVAGAILDGKKLAANAAVEDALVA